LWNRHRTTNSTADRPRSGRPRVANNRQDRLIRLRHLRNRTENPSNTATSIPTAVDCHKLCASICCNSAPHHYTSPAKTVVTKNTIVSKTFTTSTIDYCPPIYFQRRLAEAGLRARRPHQGPMLTQRHCQCRLEWARHHL
jgi:hypothetical protein